MEPTDFDRSLVYACERLRNEAVQQATMKSRAAFQEAKTTNNPSVAKTNQARSTTFEAIKPRDLVNLIQCDETTACENTETPQATISVLTALMDDLSLAPNTKDDMETVRLSSDDESDDGWSVVSDGDDFVVVDAAETARCISNNRSKEGPGMLVTPSKVHARSRTTGIRERIMVASKNDPKEPAMTSAAHGSRSKQPRHRQQRVDIIDKKHIDELVERYNRNKARALREALDSELPRC